MQGSECVWSLCLLLGKGGIHHHPFSYLPPGLLGGGLEEVAESGCDRDRLRVRWR